MAKKDVAKKDVAKKAAAAVAAATGSDDAAKKGKAIASHSLNDVVQAVNKTYSHYVRTLTPRLKLIDMFLVFLVSLGALQFVYVLLVGNFPFNAFLGGFIACVGQFVLTVSLRMQYASCGDKRVFPTISPEKAFGDYLLASLVLHFTVFHCIN